MIAGNLCKNHVKKWKADCVEKEVLERKLISDGGIPKQEKQIYVKQALEQMNPELKEIIIMFYFQDFKLKEIADILQIGLPLVKYRHKRAKEELKRLGEEDSHEPGKMMMETYKERNSVTPREEKIFRNDTEIQGRL